MAKHWSQDFQGLLDLEAEYTEQLAKWKELRENDREAAFQYRRQILEPLGTDFANARRYWREIGVMNGREGIKIEDNVE